MISWSYGITTVPGRVKDLFPRTLKSLAKAGFDKPHLFVDGCNNSLFDHFQLNSTLRYPNVRTAGHWALSIAELYIRAPHASHYALFQDDFVTYRNLRSYLEKCKYPANGYFNLYTFPSNQLLAPKNNATGWYLSNQQGKGAVALIFPREILLRLFTSEHFVNRPQDLHRGWKAIDGGIVDSMKKAGVKEYVHNPSLVQHTGLQSSMGNRPHKLANSFKGEDFNALELLEGAQAKLKPEFYTDWEIEKNSLEKAMQEDKDRLANAKTPNEKKHFTRLVANYEYRLAIHLKTLH